MLTKKVCIIVPAYNEEKRIGKTLERYGDFFSKLKKEGKIEYEILVVINNTTDRTEEVIKEKSKTIKEIRYLNLKKGGKGFAITEGFNDALKKDKELIGFTDADCSTPPEAFYDLINRIGEADAIIANRWDKKSKILKKQGIRRQIMSRIFNFIVRSTLFIPYQDTQCGAKLVKSHALKKIIKDLCVGEWAFDVNLVYVLRKEGYNIKEIPTIWEDDEASKVNTIKTSFRMFLSIMRMRLIYSPFERMRKILRPFIKIIYEVSK